MRIDDAEHFLSGLINYRNFRDFSVQDIQELPNEPTISLKEEEPLAVSVIIPVYNREKEIAECLSKLAETTFDKSRMEVLVVDDASTDETVQVIETFRNEFDHLKIIRLAENSGGASVPRNIAIKQAKGKWLLFIDSDDYVTPHAIVDAYNLANERESTDLVCMPYFRAEESSRAISRSAFIYPENVSGLDFLDTKLYNSLNVVGKMVRRSIIINYEIEFPAEIRVREDNWFSMRLYGVVREIAILGNQKEYYFIRDKDNVSLSNYRTPPRDAAKIFFTVFQFIFGLDELSSARKADIMAIYLNRYTKMIKRGKYSPDRVLEKTGQYLSLLKQSPYIDKESKQFIIDLYDAKYEVTE
ncbi:glycosyltransferase family 2 protein [Enterococcus raffinosus]|nr:glycosyltransferase family 2 protein [Enterococcus raffinosus]